MTPQSKLAWIVWAVLVVVSGVYIVLAIHAFDTLGDLDELVYSGNNDAVEKAKNTYRGGRAAAVLSIIAVIGYAAYMFFITLGWWISEGAIFGVTYGILLTASLYSSAFMLLSGVVLQANDFQVELNMDDSTYRTFQAAFIFAYAMTGVYILLLVFHVYQLFRVMGSREEAEKQVMGRMDRRTSINDL